MTPQSQRDSAAAKEPSANDMLSCMTNNTVVRFTAFCRAVWKYKQWQSKREDLMQKVRLKQDL